MNIKASTQRLIIIFGSFFLMIGCLYVFFSLIYPTYQDIQVLRAERDSKALLLSTQNEAAEKIGALLNQYSSLTTIQDALSLMMPIGTATSSLVNDIQGLAQSNSLALTGINFQYLPIRPSVQTVVRGVGTIRMGVTMTGTYVNLKNFISQLETNSRILDVSSLRADGGAVSNRDVLTYNLVVDAYYQE